MQNTIPDYIGMGDSHNPTSSLLFLYLLGLMVIVRVSFGYGYRPTCGSDRVGSRPDLTPATRPADIPKVTEQKPSSLYKKTFVLQGSSGVG